MNKRVFIIAEAGVNHNGNIEMARKLVDAAALAGADAVKFQTFKAENLAVRTAPMADYQKENAKSETSQFEMIKKLELTEEQHFMLKDYCTSKGIMFFSTAFDLESLDLLKELGLELYKIPSGEITNLPYLEKIAKIAKSVIISTGMCTSEEVHAAISALIKSGLQKEQLTVLHCNTEYPTPFQDVNLRAMKKLGDYLGTTYGYSDHTLGIEIPIAAVALGATVIEKHFTLDRNLPGPDHKASLEPQELKQMVMSIRNIELALGSDIKAPSQSEIKNRAIARKSIVAAKSIRKGELFTPSNLTTKRPGTGISPMKWYEIINTPASRDFMEDEQI